jgi:uncharacterized protein (DUF924 family)
MIQQILDFWFGPTLVDGFPEPAYTDLWFRASVEHDWQIYRRFHTVFQQALQGQLQHWSQTPQGRLALILLLDQFPRHLFRHTPNAYYGDAQAMRHCREAMAAGQDLELEPCHRLFLYAPLEHCEDVAVQQEAVENIEAFQASQSQAVAERLEYFVHWIRVHRDVVQTYGRFPWRNRALGRLNSPEEQRYLSSNPPYLGQW